MGRIRMKCQLSVHNNFTSGSECNSHIGLMRLQEQNIGQDRTERKKKTVQLFHCLFVWSLALRHCEQIQCYRGKREKEKKKKTHCSLLSL